MMHKSIALILVALVAIAFLIEKFYFESGLLKLAAFGALGAALVFRFKGKKDRNH
jgi:hypothetical protein